MELDDTEVYAYNGIGDAKRSIGLYEEAITYYNKVIELSNGNSSYAYNNRGACKIGLGLYNEAIIDINKALEIYDEYTDAYNNRGTAEYNLELYKEDGN